MTSSSIQTEVFDTIKDMVEATCQSSLSPKISAHKSPLSVAYASVCQCPSPMGSPNAYLLRLGSPSNPGKVSPTILLNSDLVLQQLPKILSPIPSPNDPSSPNILEFILDQQVILSDCSPEAPPASIPKKPSIKIPFPQDKSPIIFTITQDKFPEKFSLPQDKPTSSISSTVQLKSSVPPPLPLSSQKTPTMTSSGLSIISYADAAKSGQCKICNAFFPPTKLLDHLTSHRPCTKKYKCIKAWTLLLKPHTSKPTRSQPSTKNPHSQIEMTFREKFPDLPVFQNRSSSPSSSSSSPEKIELLKQLNTQPSGPAVSAFPKPLYSKIIHGLPTLKPTTCLFPGNSPLATCRTCFRTVEEGLSLADHCRLLHNLEVSTDRTLPSTAIVKISPSSVNPPSTRQVTQTKSSKDSVITLSVGISIPSKTSLPGPQKPLTFINSKLKIGNKIFTSNKALPQSSPHSDSENFTTKKKPSITSPSTAPPSTSTTPPSSPRKCPHCPFLARKKIGLRLHLFQVHNIKAPSTTTIAVPSTATTIEQSPSCPVCEIKTKTAKGLRVHMQQIHKISVSKPGKPISPVPASSPTISISPPVTLAPAPSLSPATASPPHTSVIIPRAEDLPVKGKSVTLIGSTLKYLFPLEETLVCPIKNCIHSFRTQMWFTTNTSLRKHLLIFHRIQLQSVEHWCSICNSIIKTRPALHPCIKSSLTAPPSKASPSAFRCNSCNFNATSQIALFLHQRTHKKESLANSAVRLKIFPTPKERKGKLCTVLPCTPPVLTSLLMVHSP
ncbi:hypothetical protein NPIL_21901, partial [Nephila pilipes]